VAALCGGLAAAPAPALAWFSGRPLAPDGLKGVDYAWVKPGLNLNGHTLSIPDWEQVPAGAFSHAAATRMDRFRFRLHDAVKIALASSGRGKVLLGADGDLLLLGRVLELKEGGFMGLGKPAESAAFDLALVDGRTREVLAGFHQTVVIRKGQDTLDLEGQTQSWANAWAVNFLASAWKPLPDAVMAEVQALPRNAPAAPAEAAKTPVQTLAADLERLDQLHRQGLLKDDEYESLRAQTVRGAGAK
jgi:hypothetical protein